MRTENWCGFDIRFVEESGEWWAILKDVCDALDLTESWMTSCLEPNMLMRIKLEGEYRYVVNEEGIYQMIFESRTVESRKFRRWSFGVMKRLRRNIGLQPYEAMRMLDKDIQEDIDNILDTLYYDEETGVLMQSVTVAGGDVDQIPFEGDTI